MIRKGSNFILLHVDFLSLQEHLMKVLFFTLPFWKLEAQPSLTTSVLQGSKPSFVEVNTLYCSPGISYVWSCLAQQLSLLSSNLKMKSQNKTGVTLAKNVASIDCWTMGDNYGSCSIYSSPFFLHLKIQGEVKMVEWTLSAPKLKTHWQMQSM